jgi:hypothetical protein
VLVVTDPDDIRLRLRVAPEYDRFNVPLDFALRVMIGSERCARGWQCVCQELLCNCWHGWNAIRGAIRVLQNEIMPSAQTDQLVSGKELRDGIAIRSRDDLVLIEQYEMIPVLDALNAPVSDQSYVPLADAQIFANDHARQRRSGFLQHNDLNDSLARVVNNGCDLYSLTYSPTNSNVDGKYRRIQVTLIRGKDTLALVKHLDLTEHSRDILFASRKAVRPRHLSRATFADNGVFRGNEDLQDDDFSRWADVLHSSHF